jgi:flagellar assembly factor FliW
MIINTRDFGDIEVEDSDLFNFPEGIYGFEEDTCFALFHKSFDNVPFLYLQSVENIVPCFLMFEPRDFYSDYTPLLSDEDLGALGAESPNELLFLVIANVSDCIKEMSINIKSPIALNPKTNIGRQVILLNSDYTVRYRPFSDERTGGSSC